MPCKRCGQGGHNVRTCNKPPSTSPTRQRPTTLQKRNETTTQPPPPKRTKQINKSTSDDESDDESWNEDEPPEFSNSDDEEAYDNIVVQRNDESSSEEDTPDAEEVSPSLPDLPLDTQCDCKTCPNCIQNTNSWEWTEILNDITANGIPKDQTPVDSHQNPGATFTPETILDSFFSLLSLEFWQTVSTWTNQ